MKKLIIIILFNVFLSFKAYSLPEQFVYLRDIDPSIRQEMRYFSHNNFVGRPLKGYESAECILTLSAAKALQRVQAVLKKSQLGLKVYDCYRPTDAVSDIYAWSQKPLDQRNKKSYYPRIEKNQLFELGYVALKSGHSRGSTVDLTIISLKSDHHFAELDMGGTYDFMDIISHPSYTHLHKQAYAHRMLLQKQMMAVGFKPLDTEWWHFTLKEEPFPDHYFNFPVARSSPR